jgi:hypothetical protein
VKPAVPVTLHSLDGGSRFPLYAIPDSGADTSCFPEDWAEFLGFDLKKCKERPVTTGAGMGCHYESDTPLKATIAGRGVDLCACFGPVLVGLLGRDDFFHHFRVEFDHRRRVSILRPYPPARSA